MVLANVYNTVTTAATIAGVPAGLPAGTPIYRMNTQVLSTLGSDGKTTSETILLRDSFVKSKSVDDVFQVQIGLRYIFN